MEPFHFDPVPAPALDKIHYTIVCKKNPFTDLSGLVLLTERYESFA